MATRKNLVEPASSFTYGESFFHTNLEYRRVSKPSDDVEGGFIVAVRVHDWQIVTFSAKDEVLTRKEA